VTEAPQSPPIRLEEARARLKELGYLDGRVERFLFRRALEGRGGLFLPAVLAGALAAALACAAVVETAEPGFARAPGALAVVFLHFFAASLLPSALGAALLALGADRVRRPAGAALLAGLFVGGLVLALWVAGGYVMGGGLLHALVWGVPVSAAALAAAESARSGFLARAYAHARRLPESRRRRVYLAVAAAGLAVAAAVFAMRRQPLAVRPPQPRGRLATMRVIAVDGLELDRQQGSAPEGLFRLFDSGATGWWEAQRGTPPEIWMNLATGVLPEMHGVRALERVRPIGSSLALRPPPGMGWYLRGVGRALKLVRSAPVSAADRRSLTFWEVYAAAGPTALAVGWWSSGPWPGAEVIGNEQVLARAADGLDVDRVALTDLASARGKPSLSTVYLPSCDILRNQPEERAKARAAVEGVLAREAAEAAARGAVLVVLAADSHPPEGGLGRMIVFDSGARAGVRVHIRPEDVAPSILARAGIPLAEDLPGRPAAALFAPASLETATVPTYGPRIAPGATGGTVTDREYLEKLRSLGYLQ
jgi:hypothetical protein